MRGGSINHTGKRAADWAATALCASALQRPSTHTSLSALSKGLISKDSPPRDGERGMRAC
jgi:hypothetical protein